MSAVTVSPLSNPEWGFRPGKSSWVSSSRLRVFFNKGCTCVECGIQGTQLALGKDKSGHLYWDVYTNEFYPLTVDHILPRSKGGTDDLENLQPMCCLCNWRKGAGDKAHSNFYKPKYPQLIKPTSKLGKFLALSEEQRKELMERTGVPHANSDRVEYLIKIKEIKVGMIVYWLKTGRKLGTVKDVRINEKDPKKLLAAEIAEQSGSLYCIHSLGVFPSPEFIEELESSVNQL